MRECSPAAAYVRAANRERHASIRETALAGAVGGFGKRYEDPLGMGQGTSAGESASRQGVAA